MSGWKIVLARCTSQGANTLRYDWYQPTIPDDPIVIVEELLKRLAPGGEVTEGRGKNNYQQSFTIADWRGGGGLEGVCRSVTSGHGVKGLAFVPDDQADGRTYRMGSPASAVVARLYDKAAELRRHLPPVRHAEIPAHMTRLEGAGRPPRGWRGAGG